MKPLKVVEEGVGRRSKWQSRHFARSLKKSLDFEYGKKWKASPDGVGKGELLFKKEKGSGVEEKQHFSRRIHLGRQ